MIDRVKYLDKKEIKQLRTVTRNQYIADKAANKKTGLTVWMLVDIALSTGLRVSELAAIKVKDIDFRRSLIKVIRLKRRKPLTESLMISPKLKKHLKRYIKQTKANRVKGMLFVSQRGRQTAQGLTAQGLAQIWKAAIKRAGLPKGLSIHSARHTMAVHLLKKTKNLVQVQKQLGHSSPVTTSNMYCDVSPEDMLEGVTGLYE